MRAESQETVAVGIWGESGEAGQIPALSGTQWRYPLSPTHLWSSPHF